MQPHLLSQTQHNAVLVEEASRLFALDVNAAGRRIYQEAFRLFVLVVNAAGRRIYREDRHWTVL